jgi:7-cyano-7-deazaguanine synthase
MKQPKTLLMLSGGLDSFGAAADLHSRGDLAAALWVDYGQKAAPGELIAAQRQSAYLGVRLYRTRIDIYHQLEFTSGLINAPLDDEGGIEQLWVPARNALLYSIGAAFAESLKLPAVGLGLNAEEAREFADNTSAFLEAANHFIFLATAGRVQAAAPTVDYGKREIIARLVAQGHPLEEVYSCYRAPDEAGRMCGTCPSCRRLKAALEANALGLAERFAH